MKKTTRKRRAVFVSTAGKTEAEIAAALVRAARKAGLPKETARSRAIK